MNNMENTSVGQRFTQLINHLGISKNAFAMSLDKTATVIQHLVEERNKPGFDLICKVFEVYPNVSKDWLLQGSGPMLTGTSEAPKQTKKAETPEHTAPEVPATLVVPAEISSAEAVARSVAEHVAVSVAPALTEVPAPRPITPEPVTPAAEPAAPAAPDPVVAPPPAAPPVVAAPTNPDAGAWQTALYTQQMAHQLAMAEMRNQHLQDQQRLMQQMMDLMQRKMM